MTSGESSSGRSSGGNWRKIVVPLIAVASTAVGTVLVLVPRPSVGWFAYAPLANEPFSSSQLMLVDSGDGWGYALILVGMMGLAFWAGYHVALRRVPPTR